MHLCLDRDNFNRIKISTSKIVLKLRFRFKGDLYILPMVIVLDRPPPKTPIKSPSHISDVL